MAKEGREIARQEGQGGGVMPWRPFAEIARVEREMDRMLGGFLGGRAGSLFNEMSNLGIREPAVDLYEQNDEIVVKAELPGLDADDIEVSITDHLLVLRGEKRKEEEVNERDYYRSERVYGEFVRTVPLPAEADPEKVTATINNGVLEIHLPKSEEAKKRQIQVQVQGNGAHGQSGGQGQSSEGQQQRAQQQESQSKQSSQGQQASAPQQAGQSKQGEQTKQGSEQSKR